MRELQQYIEKHTLLIMWGVVFIVSILYSLLSIVRHMHFQSGAYDLGIYDQAVWQYAHLLSPFNTIKMRFILGDHLTLTLPFLSPLFYLWNDAKILLIFQAVFISFSSLGVYYYLKKRTFTNIQALLLSIIYLLFYGIQFGVFFDFHPVLIGVGIAAWILYFWEAEKWKLFIVSVILLLMTQENMGMVLFALSVLWFFQGKRRKLSIVLSIVSLCITVVAFRIEGMLSNIGLEYSPHITGNLVQLVKEFFDSPEKRQVWFYSYSWYSFIPLFSPGSVIAVLSDLAQYFITGPSFARMWSPFMHHRAILSIYLLVGTADVLLFFKQKNIPLTKIILVMCIVSLALQYHFHFALDKLAKREFWHQESWMSDNNELLRHVPQDASVAAQQSLVSHLSHRKEIYLLYPRIHVFRQKQIHCAKGSCWWLDFPARPKLLVVETHDNEWLTMTLEDINNFREAIRNMEINNVIRLMYKKGEARIYTINYTVLDRIK